MELDSHLGLTKKPILFQLSQVESRTSSGVYVPSCGQSTIKRQCLVAQMVAVLKSFDGKDNGIFSATIIIQHGSQAYFIPGFRQISKGSHWRGPNQGHCGQADSRYYYTNKYVTHAASGIVLCFLCKFSVS